MEVKGDAVKLLTLVLVGCGVKVVEVKGDAVKLLTLVLVG